jgi:hypothetical protein
MIIKVITVSRECDKGTVIVQEAITGLQLQHANFNIEICIIEDLKQRIREYVEINKLTLKGNFIVTFKTQTIQYAVDSVCYLRRDNG